MKAGNQITCAIAVFLKKLSCPVEIILSLLTKDNVNVGETFKVFSKIHLASQTEQTLF